MEKQILIIFLCFAVGFILGNALNQIHNRRIRERKDTVGELQIIYEFIEGEPNDQPLVFFVSYVPIDDLHDNETVKMIVRVKNM